MIVKGCGVSALFRVFFLLNKRVVLSLLLVLIQYLMTKW